MAAREILFRILAAKAARHAEVTELLSDPEVASNPAKLKPLSRELGQLRAFARLHGDIADAEQQCTDARELIEGDDGEDAEMRELAEQELAEQTARLDELWTEAEDLLAEDDELGQRDAILEVRAGVGGDEAALFAGDLFTMYRHLCQARGLKIEVLSESAGEMGGFKEVVAQVAGSGAYNALRFESGVHRVQRVPKTESQGRIHTSAATVAVLPKPEAIDVQIDWEDSRVVREDKMRAGGPGGQKVNKTESAIRLTHLETGLTVHIQDEKSQHKNRAKARAILLARVFDQRQQAAQAERAAQRKGMVGSGDRSARIRTYNFPQSRVTDHRMGGFTTHDLTGVLEGNLGEVHAWLKAAERDERLKALADEAGGDGGAA